jgi:hypothetical protein
MAILDTANSIQIGGVNVSDEGTREAYSRDRNSMGAVRTLRCLWTDRHKVIAALQSSTVQIGTVTVIVGGAQYPDLQSWFVDSIEVEGEGTLGNGSNGMVGYQRAVLSVKYMPLDYAAAQTQIDFGKDIITIQQGGLKWADDNAVVAENIGHPITVISIKQSRYNLPSIPLSVISNATLNPLNSVSIFGFPIKCVMFEGGRSLMRWVIANGAVDPAHGGVWNFDIEYCFLARPIPWDKFLKPSGTTRGTFQTVLRADGSDFMGKSDLNALFTS